MENSNTTHQEDFRPPNGQSADIPSADEFLRSLIELDKNHDKLFGDISDTYQKEAKSIDASNEHGASVFESKMHDVNDQVNMRIGGAFLEFDYLIDKVPHVYEHVMADPAWAKVQDAVNEYGVGSTSVSRAIGLGSSSQVREAMRAALDKEVWAKVQLGVDEYGVGSTFVSRAIGLGSSSQVREAMRAALDKEVWAKVQLGVDEYGVGSTFVSRAIGLGSSSQVREAMRAALDKEVWAKVQYAVNEYSVGSSRVSNAITNGSSTATRARIAELKTLRFPEIPKEKKDYRDFYSPFEESFSAEDIFYTSGSWRKKGRDQKNTKEDTGDRQAPPKQPGAEKIATDPRVAVLRGKTTGGSDKPYKTILANIDAHRAQGKTDREIYYLLMGHFHPDRQHPDGHAVSSVLSTVYDPKAKTFIV